MRSEVWSAVGSVDVSVSRDYLGHASVATTSRYLCTNLKVKREALDEFWKTAVFARSRDSGARRTSSCPSCHPCERRALSEAVRRRTSAETLRFHPTAHCFR